MEENNHRKNIIDASFRVMRSTRILAKAIDILLTLILCLLAYPFGTFLGLIYLSLADCLNQGQSFGKKFFGLRVISLEDGTPCSSKQSFIRNLPFLIPLLFGLIPFWGWTISILTAVPLVGLELYLIFTLDSGNRLGDVMADTTVMANINQDLRIKKRKQSWFQPQN